MKINSITVFIVFLSLLITAIVFSSSGGKFGRHTAGCTCHGTLSAGNSTIDLISVPDIFTGTGYTSGNTYRLTLTVTGGQAATMGGFNLKAAAGTLSNPDAHTKILGAEATHSNPNTRTWSLDWQPPVSPVDSVVFNYAGNAADGTGSTSSDDPTVPQVKTAYAQSTRILKDSYVKIAAFKLHQNYPNPFNAQTTIGYEVPGSGMVELLITDITGKEIYRDRRAHSQEGYFNFMWRGTATNGNVVAAGVYVVRVIFKQHIQSTKIILLK